MRIFTLIVCALMLCVACDNKSTTPTPKIAFVNTDITGIDYAQKFSLIDHQGQARTLEDFRGKLVLLFLDIRNALMCVRRLYLRWRK